MQTNTGFNSTSRKKVIRRKGLTLIGIAMFVSLSLSACRRAAETNQNANSNLSVERAASRIEQQPALVLEGEQVIPQEFVESGARCATRPVLPVEARGIQRRLESFRLSGESIERTAASPAIKVNFHVINKGPDPINDGNITQQQIDEQMRVLNDTYASTHFKFELVNVDRTTNQAWYEMDIGSAEEAAAKLALGVKRKDVLNIYTARLAGSILGWAVFPWDFSANPYDDGVVIRFSTLPGGASAPYNQGKTMVHEVGHWLGLYHTFQGGCTAPGDYVDDTAAEDGPAFRCPTGLDTCADGQGPDPIDNFMDYTDDACMNRFTQRQSVRMDAMFLQYRQ